MKKYGRLEKQRLLAIENFLSTVFSGIESDSYAVDNEGNVLLSDRAANFLRTHNDHDCTASTEGSCSFCGYLMELGLLEEGGSDVKSYSGE